MSKYSGFELILVTWTNTEYRTLRENLSTNCSRGY
jgi:hypothetical protein